MSFALAAPAMLLGALLVGLPILAHLTGFRQLQTVEFPTLRFLRASQLKVRRRRRAESLLLLLVRCLAVAALAVLFARPSVTWTATSLAGLDPAVTTVVLLDRSASMSLPVDGGTVLDRAREEASRVLDGLEPGTLAAVITYDAAPDILGPGLTADVAPLRGALRRVDPGAGTNNLDRALRRARQLVEDAGVARANLFVLSDGTGEGLPPGFGATWPAALSVHYHDLLGGAPPNRWVSDASTSLGLQRGEGLRVRAEVRGTHTAREDVPVTLDLGAGITAGKDAGLEDGQGHATFAVPVPPDGRAAATVSIPPDAFPLDDVLPFALSGDSQLEVLLVSGDGGANPRDDEVYYLSRALQPGPGTLSRVKPRVVPAEELRQLSGGRGDVVFLANVADPAPLADDLLRFVEAGGGLFLSVGNRVDPDTYNRVLGDLLPARFTEVKTRGGQTFEQSPTGMALPPLDQGEFQVFRTGGAAVFSRVRFGRLIGTEPRLQSDSRVLLRYTDGLPALLERRVGDGRVVVFTSTVDDDWTDFPLRSIFPSLAHQFARGLSDTLLLGGGEVVEVGGSVRLPVPWALDEDAWVVGPGGDAQVLDRATANEEGLARFTGTDLPGHYRLYWGGSDGQGEERALFSVRVPDAESQLPVLGRDALLASVPGLRYHQAGETIAGERAADVVRTASLVPWIAGLFGLLFLVEGLLVGRRT